MKKTYPEALTAFVSLLQAQNDKEHPGYTTIKLDGNGQNFQRVVRENGQKSVVAFVAMRDGKTKTLGEYKEGDIFMPQGYAAPAKNVRGSIYEDDGLGATNRRGGIRYLK